MEDTPAYVQYLQFLEYCTEVKFGFVVSVQWLS